MKNFRQLAASLIASAVVTLASAQQTEDIASLRAKAEKGNGIAQYNLGLAYAEGHGVTVDRLEAYLWLSLARENGARGRALDNLVASLDAASLAAAKQRLAAFKGSSEGKLPVVSTSRSEPEIVTTIKTSDAPTSASSLPVVATTNATALNQQIAALTADKKQLSEEVAKAWKEIEVLQTAVAKAEKEVRTANSQTAAAAELENLTKFSRELEASLNRTNSQKTQLEQNLATVQAELTQAKADLAVRLAPSAEIGLLRTQLSTAQTQITTLNADLAAVRAEETRLHDKVAQLDQEKTQLAAAPAYPDLSVRVGELEAQLARANRNAAASIEAAQTASKQSAADLSASAAQILRLQTALSAKPAAVAYPDLSDKVRELEASLASANQKIASSDQEHATLKQQLAQSAATAETVAKARDVEAQLRRERDELSTRATALASENTELRADRERIQSALAAKPDAPAYPDLSNKVSELEASLASANQKIASSDQAQATLKQQLAQSAAAAETASKGRDVEAQLRRERDELTTRAATLASENAELRADRQRIQKTLAETDTQVRNSAADVKRIKELEQESATLRASLAAAKSSAPAYPDLSGTVRELESRLAATNQQADSAVQTAVAASKQSAADLNAAAAQIARLQAALDAKASTPSAPDLSGKVRELETQLAAASADAGRARQEIAALAKARDEALKNRGPAYPNLAGRVVELQTALADAKRDLADTQTALHAAEQARVTAPITIAAASEPVTEATDTTELQKQLAETENKLATALRGYALLQRDLDARIETATKGSDTVITERDALTTQVAALTAEVALLKSGTSDQIAAAQVEATQAKESLAALQRSTAQNTTELAAARALLQQMQGAHTVLANENYQLKARLSPGSQPAPASATPTPVPVLGPVAAARTHVVAAGDTLSRLSQRYYGSPGRWQEIYKANAEKLGTNGILRVGMELVVP